MECYRSSFIKFFPSCLSNPLGQRYKKKIKHEIWVNLCSRCSSIYNTRKEQDLCKFNELSTRKSNPIPYWFSFLLLCIQCTNVSIECKDSTYKFSTLNGTKVYLYNNWVFHLKYSIFFKIYLCVREWERKRMFMSVHHMQAGAQRDREGAQSLERKLQAVVSPLIWMLGTEPRYFTRATNTLNYHLSISSIFPAPEV